MIDINSLKTKNIYLAPKNDVTDFYKKLIEIKGLVIIGFLDNYKEDEDVIKKNEFTEEDVVIIYSPNYFKEISNSIHSENIYILYNEDESLQLKTLENFDTYKSTFTLSHNTLYAQKVIWAYCLKNSWDNSKNLDGFGYIWGDPNLENHTLGNYLKIQKLLLHNSDSSTTILEIGTLSGKWTEYMFHTQKIICVDINEYFIDVVKQRFKKHLDKIDFYVSKGDELLGIKDNSVDMIFTMDSLVRTEKEYIINYIKEITRVLSQNGKAIIHLPNSDIEDCRNRGFTNITTNEIEKEVSKYYNNYRLDFETIKHGCLLLINIDENV